MLLEIIKMNKNVSDVAKKATLNGTIYIAKNVYMY